MKISENTYRGVRIYTYSEREDCSNGAAIHAKKWRMKTVYVVAHSEVEHRSLRAAKRAILMAEIENTLDSEEASR